MSSERADEPVTPDNPRGDPGPVLAAQREAMGWSVEQVADQLKLAVRQVVALEAGDYAALPSPAVTRGFVRAYAKLMRLDPAPLVAQIAMDTPPMPDTSADRDAPRQPGLVLRIASSPATASAARCRSALIAGAVVAVVAAAAAAWHFGLVPHRGAEAEPAASSAVPAPNGATGADGTPARRGQPPAATPSRPCKIRPCR